MSQKFTDSYLRKLMPEAGKKDCVKYDTEIRGLGVRALPNGKKIFFLKWKDRATGKTPKDRLGEWGSITIDQAREAAKVRLGRVAAGFDPAAEAAAARAAAKAAQAAAVQAKNAARFTLEVLISDWSRIHLASKRPRYATEAQRALRHAFATHLTKPAAALDYEAVLKVLDRITKSGGPAIADRTRAYGRACYGWAVARRKLPVNPFAGLPAIHGGNPSRDRVLTDKELGAVWRAAGRLSAPFGPITQMLILTGARRDEIAGMRWSELSEDRKIWTLAASRAKNGKPHVVHLTEAARAILANVDRAADQDLIFSTTGKTAPSGFSRAKSQLDASILEHDGLSEPWRLHDFRRTVVTWLAGNGTPPHVADRLLNHVSGTISGVAAVYQRNEFLAERQAALEAWAAHVKECGKDPAQPDNVVTLHEVAA